MAFEKLLGNWKSIEQIKIKHLGEWKNIHAGYEKVAGEWKEIYIAPQLLYANGRVTNRIDIGTGKTDVYVAYIICAANTYGYDEGVSTGTVHRYEYDTTIYPDQGTLLRRYKCFSSSGGLISALITKEGALYIWGSNIAGELGNGTSGWETSTYIPRQIGTATWECVSCGIADSSQYGAHVMAIQPNGDLYGWGLNSSYQLGDGTVTTRTTPTKIGTHKWQAVSAGAAHTLAIDEDGYLYGWGKNSSGQVGNNSTTNVQTPTKIGTAKWIKIGAYRYFSAGIQENGDLYTWGYNSAYQLGDGTNVNKLVPTKIGSSKWKYIPKQSAYNMGAIQDNGDLYVWGNTSQGILGDGSTSSPTTTPTQVGTDKWLSCEPAYLGILAIKENKDLYGWGGNASGAFGDGTTTASLSPKKLLENIAEVHANYMSVIYIISYGEAL